MNKIELVKFTKEDVEFVSQYFSDWFGNVSLDRITSVVEKWKDSLGFCILCDGEKVGIISLSEKQDKTLSFGVMIKEDYRGKGIAKQAFELIRLMAAKAGYSMVVSSCAKANESSRRLHEKIGFKLTAIETNSAGQEMCRWQMEI